MNKTLEQAVRKHGENLLTAFPHATERDPVKLCKKLRRLETKARVFALRLCNGPAFQSPDVEDAISESIMAQVDGLLQYTRAGVPVFLNRDPRGYSLKVDDDWQRQRREARLPYVEHWDFGGYGIIAPDLSER